MYTVLRDASETLSDYLLDALQHTDGPLGTSFVVGDREVSVSTPEEMNDPGIEGLSIWLYWIVRDDQRLNAPPRRAEAEEWHRSLPLRLHYLMTPILNTGVERPETEQLILGRVLQALHDRPVFRGPDLAGELADQPTELRVRLEPVSLEEITRIWDALEAPYQLSVSYEVTVAYVESAFAPRRVAEVSQAMAVNAGPSSGLGVVVTEGGDSL